MASSTRLLHNGVVVVTISSVPNVVKSSKSRASKSERLEFANETEMNRVSGLDIPLAATKEYLCFDTKDESSVLGDEATLADTIRNVVDILVEASRNMKKRRSHVSYPLQFIICRTFGTLLDEEICSGKELDRLMEETVINKIKLKNNGEHVNFNGIFNIDSNPIPQKNEEPRKDVYDFADAILQTLHRQPKCVNPSLYDLPEDTGFCEKVVGSCPIINTMYILATRDLLKKSFSNLLGILK